MNHAPAENSVLSWFRLICTFVRYSRFILVVAWLLVLNSVLGQSTNYVLGATNLFVGPSEGSNSVVLGVTPQGGLWAATANDGWLHLTMPDENGTGSTKVIFSYDANLGPTRSGTLTVASQTITVTQCGSTYVAVDGVVDVLGAGVDSSVHLAADASGNVYIANQFSGNITEWSPFPNSNYKVLAIPGVKNPSAVAVDTAGNLYIASHTFTLNLILKWNASDDSVTTLLDQGTNYARGLALDTSGNLYIANSEGFSTGTIQEWRAANSDLITLVSSGLNVPTGLAVDAAGNVYIADSLNKSIEEWSPANSNVTTIVSSGLKYPVGVAADASGNVYIADDSLAAIVEWSPLDDALTTNFSAGGISALTINSLGNLYFNAGLAVFAVPHTFVDTAPRVENAKGANDSLPPVEPPAQNLSFPGSVISNQRWLTITGITNGIVKFSVSVNTGAPRIGFITILGQSVPIIQVSSVPALDLIALPTTRDNHIRFAFGSSQNTSFTVLSKTDLLSLDENWTVIGTTSNIAPNVFQFTDPNPATDSQRYYRVRSP